MKLQNDSTGVDKKGVTWFKTEFGGQHAYWKTCTECGKKCNVYWTTWPDNGKIICDDCKENIK